MTLNEEQRKVVAIELLAFLSEAKKESEAESKPSLLTSCGVALPAYLLSDKIAKKIPGCFEMLRLNAQNYTFPTIGGIFVIAGTTLLAATKGAEWLTGWWNGSLERGKESEQAAKQFARVIKGEPVTEGELESAFETVLRLQERHSLKFAEYLQQQGITPTHFGAQPQENG
jgi:hypothetical protein